jgi:site-specific DNA-methyltransferase (adenine-specific)
MPEKSPFERDSPSDNFERMGSLSQARTNYHPTVKPIALMRWLCRLITPPNGIVLDPFTGSGSTGAAAMLEGFNFVGIEQDAEYLEIARRRIEHWRSEANKANDLGPLFALVAD